MGCQHIIVIQLMREIYLVAINTIHCQMIIMIIALLTHHYFGQIS